MKTSALLVLLWLSCAGPGGRFQAAAQPPNLPMEFLDNEPEDPPPPGSPLPPDPVFDDHGAAGPVDRWMEGLEKRDPESFGRFQRLRLQDPAGFRREIAGRLRREHVRAGMAAHPRIREFLMNLPEEERQEIMAALARVLAPRGEGRSRAPPPSPELDALQADVKRLARAFREAKDEPAREAARSELRDKLAVLFDAREQGRALHIRHIESELAALQQMLESRRTNRQENIERRLNDLTGEDALKW